MAGSDVKNEAHKPRFNVGYQVLDFKHQKDGQEQPLTVAVWYPTSMQPKPHNYWGPTSGSVAVDAAPLAKSGPYPFLVFSHGYGGSGLGAVFFTEALAARGSKTMSQLSAKTYRNLPSPKYFLEVKGANHFSFNNSFAERLRTSIVSGTEERFEIIRRYSIAFLEKHVAGEKDSGHVLDQCDPLLTRYARQ